MRGYILKLIPTPSIILLLPGSSECPSPFRPQNNKYLNISHKNTSYNFEVMIMHFANRVDPARIVAPAANKAVAEKPGAGRSPALVFAAAAICAVAAACSVGTAVDAV